MNHFEFPRIGRDLAGSLAGSLDERQSVLVLGGRNVGKRYLIRLIYHQLRERGREVGVAELLNRTDDEEPGAAHDGFLRGIPCLPPSPEAVLRWWGQHRGSGCLIVANLDSLPTYDALRLAEQIGAIGWGGALVTCEAQGGEVLAGPTPPVRFDRGVVVSGLTPDEFASFAHRYLARIRLRPPDPEALIRSLYDRTGGNMYFLRSLLWAAFDRWAAAEGNEAEEIDLEPLPNLAAQIPWNHYLRYVTRLIGSRPGLWDRLEELVRTGSVAAHPDRPDLLELTGVPVREGDRLVLPGDVAGMFLQRHYSAQKFADLYAGQGQWDRAFGRLAELPTERLARPASVEDVADTTFLVKRLATSLYQEAADDIGPICARSVAVRERFTQGCRLILGFPDVTFWARNPHLGAPWQPLDGGSTEPSREVAELLAHAPPPGPEPLPIELPVLPADALRCLAAVVPSDHPDRRVVAVLRDTGPNGRWSRVRMELLRELFGEFVRAYQHALNDERFQARAQFRHDLGEVVLEILHRLGPDVQSIDHAVRLAADALRSRLRYNRVLVSLVDPKWERIRGYYESSEDDQKRMRQATNYRYRAAPGRPVERSIHVAALTAGRSLRVRDFPHDERADTDVVQWVALQAGAVILLDTDRRTPAGEPVYLGTLLVERADGLPPDDEEFEDLVRFGRKLAGLIEQSERIQLLQSTLDQQREPLAIYDAGGRLRYANRSATGWVVDPPAGWRPPEVGRVLDLEGTLVEGNGVRDQVYALAQLAYQNRVRLVQHITPGRAPPIAPGATGSWVVLADVINDPILRKRLGNEPADTRDAFDARDRLGTFLEAQDFSFFQVLFDEFAKLLNPDTLCPVPTAPGPLGALDPTDQLIDQIGQTFLNLLRCESACYDALKPDGNLVRERVYNQIGGPVRVTGGHRYPLRGYAQRCFDEVAPVAFHFDQEKLFSDGRPVATDLGFRATNVHSAESAPTGAALWIDFPLFAGGQRLGKMAFACDPTFPPESYEMLKMTLRLTCGIVGTILGLAQRYEEASAAWDQQRQEEGKRAIGGFIHNVLSPAKDMDGIIMEYRRLAPTDEKLERVHTRLEDTLRRFTHYGSLARRATALLEVNRTAVRLVPFVADVLAKAAPAERYRLVPPAAAGDDTVRIDHVHFAMALSELVENSRRYGGRADLLITLNWRFGPREGRTWVTIEYTDNGPGIPAAGRDQLFKHKGVIKHPNVDLGTGWGLHYVANVIRLHDGDIQETGVPGTGVRFVIQMPI